MPLEVSASWLCYFLGISIHIFIVCSSGLFRLPEQNNVFAKRVDPDETAHHEPSHLDLHYLPFCFDFLTETPILNNGSVQIQSWKRPLKLGERAKAITEIWNYRTRLYMQNLKLSNTTLYAEFETIEHDCICWIWKYRTRLYMQIWKYRTRLYMQNWKYQTRLYMQNLKVSNTIVYAEFESIEHDCIGTRRYMNAHRFWILGKT